MHCITCSRTVKRRTISFYSYAQHCYQNTFIKCTYGSLIYTMCSSLWQREHFLKLIKMLHGFFECMHFNWCYLWYYCVGFSGKNWLHTWWNCWFSGKHDRQTTDVSDPNWVMFSVDIEWYGHKWTGPVWGVIWSGAGRLVQGYMLPVVSLKSSHESVISLRSSRWQWQVSHGNSGSVNCCN